MDAGPVRLTRSTCRFAAGFLLCATSALGQGTAPLAPPASPGLPAFAGPAAPVAPEVISRDAAGRATIRAVRVTAPLKLDGKLDEAVFANLLPMSGFIQTEPLEGTPATQRTDVWLFFDNNNVYVAARCWEPHMERLVANEMRRDAVSIFTANDAFSFIFDTFYDRRSGVTLTTNAIGGRTDGQSANERAYNPDFNPVWDVQVGRFDGGWTVEAAVPFKSLRYRPGRAQIWGFNARRHTPWKNETSFLMPTPAARGAQGIIQTSIAATVVGLEAPANSRNLEIKPFATSSVTTDAVAAPAVSNDLSGDVGVDVKYGVTQGLTADFTYNTDFAQVEADEQQVNLTRFSLFFPEKREFFLENKGTFDFGGTGVMGGSTDTPTLFYSRRIGLYQGSAVPILAGGRLTGRVGRYSVGLLNIQSGRDAASGATRTNFAVARVKRDLFRRSSIGALVTRRSVRERRLGSNDAYGVDGAFAFFNNLSINTYWARTRTDGLHGEDVSYRAQLDYAGDRYGLQVERLLVGDNFNPEVGFLRRDNMRKSYAQARFSPRPRTSKVVRKYSWTGAVNYIENGAGRLETRQSDGDFSIEFHNSDKLLLGASDHYELLTAPFRIAPGVAIPARGYGFSSLRAGYNFGQSRKVYGNVAAERGTFYNGHSTTVSFRSARAEITHLVSVEPNISFNWVDLPAGSFTTRLIGSRVTYTMTPRMFASALVQYNSSNNSLSSNVRLRWEYRPGSEFFIVFNDGRDTLAPGFPRLANRAFIVKINRLFRL